MLRELRDWAEELACRAGLDGWPAPARIAAAVAAAALVAMAVWRWAPLGGAEGSAGERPVAESASQPPGGVAAEATGAGRPAMPASVTVHVVGAVRRPGVYVLPAGARAADAVQAAGGLLGSADQSAVNLARTVDDGEQIAVPVQGAAGSGAAAAGSGGGASAAAAGSGSRGGPGGKVDLNTATAAQLDTLPGVGPVTAQKIVDDRTENGPFRTVEDLLRVPGIGPSKFDALKDLVRVG